MAKNKPPLFSATIIHAIFISTAIYAQEIRAIKVEFNATEALESLSEEPDVTISVTLKDSKDMVLESGRFTAVMSKGKVTGTYPIDIWPESTSIICLNFSAPEISSELTLFRQCEGVTVSSLRKSSYRDSKRIAMGLDEVFAAERARLSKKIDTAVHDDSALIETTAEVESLISSARMDDLNLGLARLVSDLLVRSGIVGTRLPTESIFKLGEDYEDAVTKNIEALVIKDTPSNNSRNFAAKELLLAMMQIDLQEYAKGRPNFISNYFRSIFFVAKARHRITVDLGYSGGLIAKELAIFCKDISDATVKLVCAKEFEEASRELIDGSRLKSGNALPSDLVVALRYHSETMESLNLIIPDSVLRRFTGKF